MIDLIIAYIAGLLLLLFPYILTYQEMKSYRDMYRISEQFNAMQFREFMELIDNIVKHKNSDKE